MTQRLSAYRIFDSIDIHGPDECWPWMGRKSPRGYPLMNLRGAKWLRGNRVIFAFCNGPLAEKEVVRHTCDNPTCLNPRHLLKGTMKENAHDMLARGRQNNQRKTHCKRGHALDGVNLMVRKTGTRACRTCHNERARMHKKKTPR